MRCDWSWSRDQAGLLKTIPQLPAGRSSQQPHSYGLNKNNSHLLLQMRMIVNTIPLLGD